MKFAKGRKEYLRFTKGQRLTRQETIAAKCYECMAFYVDGIYDCEISDCPLYPYNPVRPRHKQTLKMDSKAPEILPGSSLGAIGRRKGAKGRTAPKVKTKYQRTGKTPKVASVEGAGERIGRSERSLLHGK